MNERLTSLYFMLVPDKGVLLLEWGGVLLIYLLKERIRSVKNMKFNITVFKKNQLLTMVYIITEVNSLLLDHLYR